MLDPATGIPKNIVVHGSVSNPDEVPGFMVEVDDFMAFMERVGVWPKNWRDSLPKQK